MKRYRLSRLATKDLDGIWLDLAQSRSIAAANRFIDEVTALFVVVAAMPESGRGRSGFEAGLRCFPKGDYIVYYRRAKRGGVEISRIIHGAVGIVEIKAIIKSIQCGKPFNFRNVF